MTSMLQHKTVFVQIKHMLPSMFRLKSSTVSGLFFDRRLNTTICFLIVIRLTYVNSHVIFSRRQSILDQNIDRSQMSILVVALSCDDFFPSFVGFPPLSVTLQSPRWYTNQSKDLSSFLRVTKCYRDVWYLPTYSEGSDGILLCLTHRIRFL